MTVGTKYHEVTDNSAVTIAKAIRADIKEAKELGLLPKHWKYSVRSEYYSMGQSINISAESNGEAWLPEDLSKCHEFCDMINTSLGFHSPRCDGDVKMSPMGERVRAILQEFYDSYNHNNSDPMTDYFDVRYYGSVRVY